MRIIVIGQAPFGAAVLEKLVEKGEDEIVGVFAPPERRGRPDPLSAKAEELNVPLVTVTSMKTDEIYETIVGMQPDIGVMAFVTLSRARTRTQHSDPWNHPVSSIPSPQASWRKRHKLGHHQRRGQDGSNHLLA